MGNIVLLDDLTINKIAAGEVIERPASVIKEMVENSIDAGATNITVEIKNGGISFIKVTDNGKGIAQDDLEIAFERHATSKIRSADDLDTVTSMGFRGEALASIAAIANVELVSKTQNQENGYRVVVEAGNILEREIAPSSVGTCITVKNLFFNTPVRYKFLKKDYTESGYIEDVITRIALVNPNIAIKLINTGKTVIQTNGNGDLKTVIYSIYGKNVSDAVVPVSYTYEDIQINGVIGKPEIARSNRSYQLFFVNKRYIRDKVLSSATEQAYKGMIPLGKFGFAVLNITISPAKVDVNVHPAKLEVRFQEESKIFQVVFHAIKDTLLKSEDKDGLFGMRKPDEKQIEAYTQQESDIKTNMKTTENLNLNLGSSINSSMNSSVSSLSSGVNSNTNSNINPSINSDINPGISSGLNVSSGSKIGEPIDTYDILEKLRKLKEELELESVTSNTEGVPANTEGVASNKEGISSSIEGVTSNEVSKQNQENLQGEIDTQNIVKKEEIQEQNIQDLNSILSSSGLQSSSNSGTDNKNIEQENNKIEPISVSQVIEKAIQENEVSPQSIEQLMQEYRKMQNEVEMERLEKDEYRASENLDNLIGLKDVDNRLEDISQDGKKEQDEKGVNQEITSVEKMYEGNIKDSDKVMSFDEMYKKMFGRLPLKSVPIQEENEGSSKKSVNAVDIIKDNVSVFENIPELKKQQYKFIGIVFNTYIIIEMNKEMYIIDQHAAHERILYEKVKKNYYSSSSKDSQMLLLPDVITLTHKEMDIAKENMDMFKNAGFDIEEFGENTVRLAGVPTICIDLDNKDLFLETLDEINTVARTAKQEKEEKFIATVACKAAVKANMALTGEEVESLIDKMLELPNPFSCPHGRPTAIKMSKYDIERKFARK